MDRQNVSHFPISSLLLNYFVPPLFVDITLIRLSVCHLSCLVLISQLIKGFLLLNLYFSKFLKLSPPKSSSFLPLERAEESRKSLFWFLISPIKAAAG